MGASFDAVCKTCKITCYLGSGSYMGTIPFFAYHPLTISDIKKEFAENPFYEKAERNLKLLRFIELHGNHDFFIYTDDANMEVRKDGHLWHESSGWPGVFSRLSSD